MDALQYAPGGTICRVEVWGDVQNEKDKLAGRHRKVLWMADANKALRLFACDCAEEACRVAKQTDPRSLNAIRVTRLYAEGRATNKEMAAARAAARDAVGAAAGDAPRAAEWAAARAAEWAAARAAAGAAAWAAEWAAARVAEWAAAGVAQNEALTKRLLALKPRETK
jgi:hypothetical protein